MPEAQKPTSLRDTLAKLAHHTRMARTTRDSESARLRHIESAAALAETALWQLDHHPACKDLQP